MKYAAIILISSIILMSAAKAATAPASAGAAVSKKLFDLINEFETGFNVNKYLKAYQDPVGIWTIGYGSIYNFDKNRRVQAGDQIDEPTARRWMEREIKDKRTAILGLVKRPLNQNQLDSIVSLVYNIGVGAFGNSTMLKRINLGEDKQAIANEFDKWVYAGGKKLPGLVRRRAAEKKLFLS